jgi:hypothetical protein
MRGVGVSDETPLRRNTTVAPDLFTLKNKKKDQSIGASALLGGVSSRHPDTPAWPHAKTILNTTEKGHIAS